mgnify:CR=1 FL=1
MKWFSIGFMAGCIAFYFGQDLTIIEVVNTMTHYLVELEAELTPVVEEM